MRQFSILFWVTLGFFIGYICPHSLNFDKIQMSQRWIPQAKTVEKEAPLLPAMEDTKEKIGVIISPH